MEGLLVLLGLGLLVALAVAVFTLISAGGRRREHAALTSARWQVAHRSDGARTLVVVQHVAGSTVLDERPVGTLDDADPDWEAHFAELMGRARVRAAALGA